MLTVMTTCTVSQAPPVLYKKYFHTVFMMMQVVTMNNRLFHCGFLFPSLKLSGCSTQLLYRHLPFCSI